MWGEMRQRDSGERALPEGEQMKAGESFSAFVRRKVRGRQMTHEKVIGEQVKKTMTVRVCGACGNLITSIGCEYGCKYDSANLDERPAGSMIERVWERVDTLVSQRVL